MQRRRVVVTGLGAVSPVGNTAQSSWENVKSGKSGIGRITLFDASALDVQIAGEVKGFDIKEYGVSERSMRKTARFSRFFLASAIQAAKDAGLSKETLSKTKSAVCSASCIGGFDIVEDAYKTLLDNSLGSSRLSSATVPMFIANEAASAVSIYFSLSGPSWTLSNACASGTDSLVLALDTIRSGRADVCFAGGTETPITEFTVAALSQLGALARGFNEEPEKASRPFDRDRKGFVLSEGAAVLILEEEEHAKSRGAKIYAEVLGAASSCDAYHIASPKKDGSGAAMAVKAAIEDSGIKASDIQYYNAHGTGTIANDISETAMIKSVFGEYASSLHISSTKGATGHLIGASGALEALFCVKAIEDGFIPPTINLENPDTANALDLDYTAKQGVPCNIQVAMSGSFGFGGQNSCIILGAYNR